MLLNNSAEIARLTGGRTGIQTQTIWARSLHLPLWNLFLLLFELCIIMRSVILLSRTYPWSTQGNCQLLKSFLSIFTLHSALHIWQPTNKSWYCYYYSFSFSLLTASWFYLFQTLSSSCSRLSKCNSSLCPEYIAVNSQYFYVDSDARFDVQRKKQQERWDTLKGQAEVMWWPLKASHLHPNYLSTAGSALWHIVLD